ncbi:MAG: NADPH-dependent oxidoreductase [Gallionellales bacterium RIFCSPLOWO2_12_FULL_59_22]|nr:MAG: NADPH-dependent oxidoreductase [Gallionellales bacterium RIFCSPLOWO2_02_FULL_59_110]OGT01590.1 MAG: NADPH-dependent oxidoreductase [Gallionellales bacterium RIFCSPLOWO2_02_58_13]OGT14441.1 MAG: NADPH-dependent oxidoreductase [Gallionellales bacterium RIFCSPLOWO2_12_FULL_59_22]
MNETLRTQHSHRSIRSYKADPVSDAMLDQIVAAAHRAPTSMNAQDISLIVVRDAEKRARIAELAGGQAWVAQAPVFIVIAIDYHKTDLGVRKAGQAQIIHESMEGFGVAAVDAGIALGTLITAAESLGLGIVPIGGIRRNPQDMIDLLGLPPLTFPLVGLCIGHIGDDMPLKPRLDIKTFRHDERYDASGYAAAIDAYDAEIMDYWQKIGNKNGISWSSNLGNFYKQVYFPQVKPVATMQGLLNDK